MKIFWFIEAINKYDLIYIFRSNRVYDTRDNRKIYELNVRTKIHDLIYENLIEIN